MKNILIILLSMMFIDVNAQITWEKVTSFPTITYEIRSISQANDGTILIGTTKGLFTSIDNGASWFRTAFADTAIRTIQKNKEGVIYLIAKGEIFCSKNNGLKWKKLKSSISDDLSFIAFNSKREMFVGLYSSSIYRYREADSSFVAIFRDTNFVLRDLAVDSKDGLYAGMGWGGSRGMSSGGIYKLKPDDNSWAFVNNGLSTGNNKNEDSIFLLFVDHQNNNDIIYASGSTLYRSTDAGNTWIVNAEGLVINFTQNPVYRFIRINDNILLAIANSGIYKLNIPENRWVKIDQWPSGINLNPSSTYQMFDGGMYLSSSSSIYVNGTYAGTEYGLYKGKYSVTSVDNNVPLSSTFILEQNYPNPFNPTTTIKYSIPVETRHASSLQHVTLKVYDMLGREVSTLVNEEKPAGNYEVKFDGSSMPSGIYFYRMQCASFTETKKFILVK